MLGLCLSWIHSSTKPVNVKVNENLLLNPFSSKCHIYNQKAQSTKYLLIKKK